VLTPAEMAEADRRAIAAGTPERTLVDRAGRAVARRARTMLGGTYGRRVTIVAGKGNNGADGRVAARALRTWGTGTDEFALDQLDRDDRVHDQFLRALGRANLFVDAMFGTGFRGALDGTPAWVARAAREAGCRTLAVDIPSGVDGATGTIAGEAVQADATVCFVARKPGLLFEPGRSHAGRVHVVDIGIDAGSCAVEVPEISDLRLPDRDVTAHKWSSGLMVFGGSLGMTGAPLMAARAAGRTGAAMVVCALPGSAAGSVAGSEIVTRALPATDDGHFDEDAARVALKDIARFRAIAVGPGLGRDDRAQAAARRLIAEAPGGLVVDADGLNALAVDPAPLRVRHAAALPPAVLTPHAGEYERLAGGPVGPDRLGAARELARRLHSVVVLKGPGTVIAAPDGALYINPTDSAALATAGTGDVLTGIIGGFLANGATPIEAAVSGVYVHGQAARTAGTGPDLVATDLIAALHPTLDALRNGRDLEEE
jgi:ADP-dependent NAD(P)H-hydrate dehydratase / NAD(P)H-hydrate epimerase